MMNKCVHFSKNGGKSHPQGIFILFRLIRSPHSLWSMLSGTDPHHIHQLINKNLTVSVLPGMCCSADSIYRTPCPLLTGNHNFKFHLRKNIDVHVVASHLLLISHLRATAHHL